jgi:hypothetical protein
MSKISIAWNIENNTYKEISKDVGVPLNMRENNILVRIKFGLFYGV